LSSKRSKGGGETFDTTGGGGGSRFSKENAEKGRERFKKNPFTADFDLATTHEGKGVDRENRKLHPGKKKGTQKKEGGKGRVKYN